MVFEIESYDRVMSQRKIDSLRIENLQKMVYWQQELSSSYIREGDARINHLESALKKEKQSHNITRGVTIILLTFAILL